MFTLERRDVGDGREDIGTVGSRTLNTVSNRRLAQLSSVHHNRSPVVDTSLSGLVVDVKVLEVVVEVDASGTKVSTEKGGVGGEDGGDVNVSLSAQGDS